MDPLVEVPYEQWPVLQKELRNLWPLNVAGYYALYTNINYSSIKEAFQFKVFSVFGDIKNGFVATSTKGASSEYIIFSTSEDTKPLEAALIKTKLVKWTELIVIDLVSSLTLKALDNVLPQMNLSLWKTGRVKTYFLDKCPPNTYLAALNQDHIQRVDDTWPYKHEGSYFYFSTLATANLAHGIFLAKDHKLLAWVFLNEYNFICHLYCEEEHRRKGYSEYLLKYVINDELTKGNDVYTYVEDHNEKSSRLFDKLGFANVDDGAYMFIQK
ncbi:hypothetical protein ABMA28_006234 [Loxostege sticticalis]|uniref:N-acetyltransferase domain-containing protein n=1 Tax=Loxostege sticticalis TaxID=481309 RepID=A0ABD0SMU9_LOXSC